ncbi:MAG TPA: hypothetical protein VNT76_04470 [Candidatus Binatus sp.]|nr:hypothetical protein [Candidatus Binatus sp.]
MFSAWSYAQTFRAIGQSLEEQGVNNFFALSWENDQFVVRGRRREQILKGWLDKMFRRTPDELSRAIEIQYTQKNILWLQIQGEAMRKRPGQTPDYFRLSQTLRTVGAYIDNLTFSFLSLTRTGGTFTLELRERSGGMRIEKHGVGSFENYFLRSFLRRSDRHQS